MTRLRYDGAGTRAWAAFSDDFNPAYFDPLIAARLGLARMPVHGMRVMVDVKAALYRQLAMQPQTQGQSLLFNASQRAPILHDSTYRLRIDEKENGYGFSVTADNGGDANISGSLRPATQADAADRDRAARCAVSVLKQADVIRATAPFVALSDEARPAWLLLDALLFRHLLRHRDALFDGVVDGKPASASLSHRIVLPIHQTTLISPLAQRLTQATLIDDIAFNGLHFEIEAPLLSNIAAGTTASGIALRVSLTARSGRALLLRTSVGLLAMRPHFAL